VCRGSLATKNNTYKKSLTSTEKESGTDRVYDRKQDNTWMSEPVEKAQYARRESFEAADKYETDTALAARSPL